MAVVLRRAFAAAAVAWAALLVVVPLLASRTHATPFGTAIVVAAYGIGSLVCHQLPERSYRLWNAQMPVCARCTGVYFGAAIAAVIGGARGFQPSVNRGFRPRSPERLALRTRAGRAFARAGEAFRKAHKEREPFRRAETRLLLVLAALPTAITLVYEWTTGVTPSNALRFAAGVPIGVVVASLVVSAAEDQVN